tara:strand:- start:1807 stop:2892 length:1086 start_codon:yes stop_codon:yes gene_type:complete
MICTEIKKLIQVFLDSPPSKYILIIILSLFIDCYIPSIPQANEQIQAKKIHKKNNTSKTSGKQNINTSNFKKNQIKKFLAKTVIGFYGLAKSMAEDWLEQQSEFISLEYISTGRERFFSKGTLSGVLSNGNTVSIEIQEDFYDGYPGMILDHLNALRHRARMESFVKKDLKRQFIVSEEFRVWMEAIETELEKKRQQEINKRLKKLLQSELSTIELGVIMKLEEKLQPNIRKMVSTQIEMEVRREFPSLSPNRMDRMITRKNDRELIKRVENELENTILNEATDDSSEWNAASPLIHRVMSQHRFKVITQVNAEYAALRIKRLKAMRKRFGEEGRVWSKKKTVGSFKKILLGIEKWWNEGD